MFESIAPAPPDPILGLTEAFREDPHPDKINLTVGLYKDASGNTPLLQCVRQAERRLLDAGDGGGYLPIDGLASYDTHVRRLLLGEATEGRAMTAQTPGGTGALRVAAEFIRRLAPDASIWCSTPTWANHPNVFTAASLPVHRYPYIDSKARQLDFAAMCAGLREIPSGDVVCLHACCHNPTGIDPTAEQWREIGSILSQRNILPLVDMAYQGFGDGLQEDAAGVVELAQACPELLICSSFSKNFSLYSERVGALTVVAGGPQSARTALSHVKACIRANYSNPPRHGASVVAVVLDDHQLRQQWEQELAEMRSRIRRMRELFVETMAQAAPQHDFQFIKQQRGMFSNSGLNPMQVDRLRNEFSVYVVGDGRINVAGMTEQNMPRLCQAVAAVL